MSDDTPGFNLAAPGGAAPEAPVDAPSAPAPAPEPAPEQPSSSAPEGIAGIDLGIGGEAVTFICVKRDRVADYVDTIGTALASQFLIPAAPAHAIEHKLGGQKIVVFSFPTAPGVIEYDVLSAYLFLACASLA